MNEGMLIQKDRGSLRELHDFLKEFDTAMLVTVTPEGMLRGRPMALQDPDALDDCDLWFVTPEDSAKVHEITGDHRVCICCFRSRDKAYISISAMARMEKSTTEVRRLWKPDWKAWFPNGPEDPSITLLKLNVLHAEYWEPEGGRLRVLFDMLRSIASGEPAEQKINPPKHVKGGKAA